MNGPCKVFLSLMFLLTSSVIIQFGGKYTDIPMKMFVPMRGTIRSDRLQSDRKDLASWSMLIFREEIEVQWQLLQPYLEALKQWKSVNRRSWSQDIQDAHKLMDELILKSVKKNCRIQNHHNQWIQTFEYAQTFMIQIMVWEIILKASIKREFTGYKRFRWITGRKTNEVKFWRKVLPCLKNDAWKLH